MFNWQSEFKFLMSFKDRIKHFWHDFYFKIFGKPGEHFAMKCQDIASQIDLHRKPKGLIPALRFYTHLSLCKACANYYHFSQFIQKKLQELISQNISDETYKKLNEDLVKKYKKDFSKDSN